MAYLSLVTLLLTYWLTPGSPFGWNPFDYDDDDSNVNNTLYANTTASPGPFSCQTLQPVFDYLNDWYGFLDETFNPFYEPPEQPINVTTTPAPQQG